MNELIVIEKYEGHDVAFRREDGCLNLTALCRAFGKRSNDFMRLPSTKRGITLQRRVKQRLQSTWLHPMLAVSLRSSFSFGQSAFSASIHDYP